MNRLHVLRSYWAFREHGTVMRHYTDACHPETGYLQLQYASNQEDAERKGMIHEKTVGYSESLYLCG